MMHFALKSWILLGLTLLMPVGAMAQAETALEEIQAQFHEDLRKISVAISESEQDLSDVEHQIESIRLGSLDRQNGLLELDRTCELGCRVEMHACKDSDFRSAFALLPDDELRLEERLLNTGRSTCGVIEAAHPQLIGLSPSCAAAAKKCLSARAARIGSLKVEIPRLKAQVDRQFKRRNAVLLQFAEVLKKLGYRAEVDQSKPDWRNQPSSDNQDGSDMLGGLCVMLDGRMNLNKK